MKKPSQLTDFQIGVAAVVFARLVEHRVEQRDQDYARAGCIVLTTLLVPLSQ